jgi:hypothetical protein
VPISPEDLPREAHDPVQWAMRSLSDDQTCLLAVTGSLANSTWRAGWSDIDLLLIRRSLPAEWLGERPDGAGVDVHVSMVTVGEVTRRELTPRVLNALRMITEDGRGVLVSDPTWSPPRFDLATGASASLLDLPQALLLLRRFLSGGVDDVRRVYKAAVLIARIELRSRGIEPDSSDAVVETAFRRLPGLEPNWLPRLDDMVEAVRDDPRRDVPGRPEVEAAVRRGASLLLDAVSDTHEHRGGR